MCYFSYNKTESNEMKNRRLAPFGLQISGFVFAPFYRILLGRSERDSNSRYAFGVYTLSRRASSATRASLLVFAFAKIVQIERRKKSLLVFSSEKTAILVNAKIEGSAVAAGSHRVEDYAIFSGFSGDFHYINALFKFFGCRFDSVRLFYAC